MGDYIRLGELLVHSGLISEDQLKQALALQEQELSHQRLGNILVSLGLITEDHLCRALSAQLGVDIVDLSIEEIEPRAIEAVPEQWAVRHQAVPVRIKDNVLFVATSDPTNRWLVPDISEVTGHEIRLLIAPEADVRVALRRQYEALRNRRKAAQRQRAASKFGADAAAKIDEKDLAALPSLHGGPTEQASEVADRLIKKAVEKRASDVGMLAQEAGIVVRYRVDGVFQNVGLIPKEVAGAVMSRIKIMANLDVTEHRRPQEGRLRYEVDRNAIDLRVVVIPTMHGESLVLRVLDRRSARMRMDALGLYPAQLETILEHSRRPQGLLLLTGPTGSGKTTTIYALLNEIYTPELNILTLEDPVEYEMEGIAQVQIDERAGLTFDKGLRSFLRASSNVIFVGEIRDNDTAQLALQAGLTGHLVLSTMHTSDSASTVLRLISMGIEPFLISSTLSLVVAQRLIRRVCKNCRRPLKPSPGILRFLRITDAQAAQHAFYGGTGCEECDGTGYKGRLGIYEVLEVNDRMRAIMLDEGKEEALRVAVRDAGVRSLRQEALTRAFQGYTTLEEVARVTDARENLEDRCPRCGLPLPRPGRPCPKCGILASKGIPPEEMLSEEGHLAPDELPDDLVEPPADGELRKPAWGGHTEMPAHGGDVKRSSHAAEPDRAPRPGKSGLPNPRSGA